CTLMGLDRAAPSWGWIGLRPPGARSGFALMGLDRAAPSWSDGAAPSWSFYGSDLPLMTDGLCTRTKAHQRRNPRELAAEVKGARSNGMTGAQLEKMA